VGVRPTGAGLRPLTAVASACLALFVAASAADASAEPPDLEVQPATLELPETDVGSSSSAVVTLVNVGGGAPVVEEVVVVGDGFTIEEDECTDRAVADSCTVEVGFEPERSGDSVGTITFHVATSTFSGDLAASASAPPPTSAGAMATAPPPVTTGDSTEPDAPAETDLQRCEREAGDAEVSFVPSADMVVGQTEEVVVRASVGELEISTGTLGGPSTTIVEVSLHCEVRAVLRGVDFEIDPPDQQEASFLDEATIEWIWQVRPLRAGALTLHLEILPVARTDGTTVPGSPRRFETNIRVDAADRSVFESTTDFFSALVDYPLVKGFGSLAAIAALVAGWWRWGRGRKSQAARSAPARRRRRRPSPVR
jgi:hypothetical protein